MQGDKKELFKDFYFSFEVKKFVERVASANDKLKTLKNVGINSTDL